MTEPISLASLLGKSGSLSSITPPPSDESDDPELRTIPINNFWLGQHVHAEYGTSGSIKNAAAAAGLTEPFNCLQFGGKTAWTPTHTLHVAYWYDGSSPPSHSFGYSIIGQPVGALVPSAFPGVGEMLQVTGTYIEGSGYTTGMWASGFPPVGPQLYIQTPDQQVFWWWWDGTTRFGYLGSNNHAAWYQILEAHNGRTLPLKVWYG